MNAQVHHEAHQAAQETTVPPADPKAKAQVETVQMEDGTTADFAGKKKMLKETHIPSNGHPPVVTLKFRNGKIRRFTIPHDLVMIFAGHGAEQKLGDETAGVQDIDDMYADVDALATRLEDTTKTAEERWFKVREGGGSIEGSSLLIKALMEYAGKTLEQVKSFLEGKTAAEKKAIKASPAIKPIVERLEAERLAKAPKVDTDAILQGLSDL